MKNFKRPRNKGFTLLDLLVVLTLISVISYALFPSFFFRIFSHYPNSPSYYPSRYQRDNGYRPNPYQYRPWGW